MGCERKFNELLKKIGKGDGLSIDALTLYNASEYLLNEAEGKPVMLNGWGKDDNLITTRRNLQFFKFVFGYLQFSDKENFVDIAKGRENDYKSSLIRVSAEVWRQALLETSPRRSLELLVDLNLALNSFFPWRSGKVIDFDCNLLEVEGLAIGNLLVENNNELCLTDLRREDYPFYNKVLLALAVPIVRHNDNFPPLDEYMDLLSKSVFVDSESMYDFYSIYNREYND